MNIMSISVYKRNGTLEHIDYNKINNRIKYLCLQEPALSIPYDEIVIDIISTIKNEITTTELDEYAARLCAGKRHLDNEYYILASRIAVSNHHKNTIGKFSEVMLNLKNDKFLDADFIKYIKETPELDSIIDYSRDYRLDYFGHMTSIKAYLLRDEGKVIERMQELYLRVSVSLYLGNIDLIKECYDMLSLGYISHATPTLYNAGTHNGQLASCFLLGMKDSIDEKNGIGSIWKNTAKISKRAGGIGLCMTNIRSSGSIIKGTNGRSDGIVPLCKVLNDISRYVNQGGKRKGSFAIYIEPWHKDIMAFLDLRKNHGNEEDRARDLFTALWIPDIFMRRIAIAISENKPVQWTLMCPNNGACLYNLHNAAFDEKYEEYESIENTNNIVIPDIRTLWYTILAVQQETGTPYILYKDSINRKNNQSNLGTIRNSNLCAEIVEYSDDKEHAVCNLASIPLHNYINTNVFSFDMLMNNVRTALRNLDRVIDITYYPTKQNRLSNIRHRPVGLGVQGLADTFMTLRIPFDSDRARELNKRIFETIYYGCMYESMTISKERYKLIAKLKAENYECNDDVFTHENIIITREEYNRDSYFGSYSSYIGSPMHAGQMQFDLWNETPSLDWSQLRKKIRKYGVRNSLTTAVMPTASTAILNQCTECIEPIKSNLYTRRTLNGEYVIYNIYLQEDLKAIGLWTEEIKKKIIEYRGSIQEIMEIPQEIRDLYKTAFEIKQKVLLDLARDRAPFIDQTQSMNLFFTAPNNTLLTNCHIYSWKAGLKTGMYYLRRQAAVNALQFTVSSSEECQACSA